MLVFGRKYDEETIYAIYIKKEGKYLYLSKPYDDYDNKEFRMDLTNGQFERINHYKTVETKITPVKVSSITGWFRDCSLFCNDEKFCKVIIYAKHLTENNRFKSSVRFIECLTDDKPRCYEAWLSLGIEISDIKESIQRCIQDSDSCYRRTTNKFVRFKPGDFSKSTLKYIRDKFTELSTDAINEIHSIDENNYDITLIDTLLRKTNEIPQYREFFTARVKKIREEEKIFNIFDLSKNKDFSNLFTMKNIIGCISEYNLDVDAFLAFCLRMYNVEGLTRHDLFETRHYNDYLHVEKQLKHNQMRKMDKYPQHFLSTFHMCKREYSIRRKELDEEAFRIQCDTFRDLEDKFGKYSIIIPTKTAEIDEEANELKHCVSMYIPKVIKGDTLICFLRHNENIHTPLVTIEVKEGFVTQAYGLLDSKPSEEQLRVLRKWAKKHSLKLSWAWG